MNNSYEMVDVARAERAAACQRYVDGLVERRIEPGRIGVPELEIARRRRLPQRPDPPERDLCERNCALVLGGLNCHRLPSRPRELDLLCELPRFRTIDQVVSCPDRWNFNSQS
jgi:hypothetical protein